MPNTMIKYHYYKLTRTPDVPYKERDISTGLTAFMYPQGFKNYLGYLTPEEADKLMNNRQYKPHSKVFY